MMTRYITLSWIIHISVTYFPFYIT